MVEGATDGAAVGDELFTSLGSLVGKGVGTEQISAVSYAPPLYTVLFDVSEISQLISLASVTLPSSEKV